MPSSTSMPVAGSAVASAPPTSPSVISRMRTPALRTSATSSSWRGRSRMTAVRSSTRTRLASAIAARLWVALRRMSIAPRAIGPTAILFMYVSGAFRNCPCSAIATTASASPRPFAHRLVPSSGSTAMSISGASAVAVADLLADVQHRRLVALALADDDAAADVHVAEGAAHRLDGGAVGAVAVAEPDEAGRRQRRRLGDANDFESEVSVHGGS